MMQPRWSLDCFPTQPQALCSMQVNGPIVQSSRTYDMQLRLSLEATSQKVPKVKSSAPLEHSLALQHVTNEP